MTMKRRNDFFYFKEDFLNNSENFAAAKGIYDVDYCLERTLKDKYINKESVSSIEVEGKSKLDKVFYYFSMHKLRLLYSLSRIHDKNIFLQYPFYKGKIFDHIMKNMMEKNQVFLIVHDVDSIRMESVNEKEEIDILNLAHGLILMQGKNMKNWLINHGVQVKHILTMDIYDYIVPDFIPLERHLTNEIAFAGNLRKSSFLDQLNKLKKPFKLNLYGPFYEDRQKALVLNQNVRYWGNYSPIELLTELKGSFGLIWDGNSIDTENGKYGKYNRYNIPFKFPMYIVSGMPIICWKDSGIADFVRKHNLGLCINSLNDINEVVSAVTPEQYQRMRIRVLDLRKKLMTGELMTNAIQEAIDLWK